MADVHDPTPAPRGRRRHRYRYRRKRQETSPKNETPLHASPTLDEKLATLDITRDESDGEDCELHTYESRHDSRGVEVMLRVGTSFSLELDKKKSHRAALVLFREFDSDQELGSTYIEIRSTHIRTALRNVIVSYPGVAIQTTGYITIFHPPRCLFHYREELKQYTEGISNPNAKDHMHLFLGYINRTLKAEILSLEATMKPKSEPMVEHKHLWCFFKPRTLVYATFHDFHIEGDHNLRGRRLSKGLFRLLSITPIWDELFHDTVKTWNLELEYIDYTGEKHAYAKLYHRVSKFDGLKCLKDINPTPLEFHPDAEGIMEECLRKGKKFTSLCGVHYRFAAGVGRYSSQSRADSSTWSRIMEHRIMIDFTSFWQNPVSRSWWFSPHKGLGTDNEETPELSDVEFMLCTSSVPGFSFTLRQWGIFDIDDIREIDFNLNVFEQLCIPEERKDLILSLVSQHDQSSTSFDDIIQGKGKGLIFLLHGPPGVGKTLTAESIADHTRRPLMAVSSGDLLGDPEDVELALKDIFQQTKRWGALVLIDEADVFLQQRDMLSLERNGLVSIMLRILEYFEGILFLTTNRVETIDTAFRSRIHLALYYPPLSTDYLQKLWKNTIIRACNDEEPTWLTEEMLDFLSKSKVNGRDIKNIVRMAHARATNKKRQMESNDITIGLGALEEFSEDFYRQKTKQGPLQGVCCSQDLAG